MTASARPALAAVLVALVAVTTVRAAAAQAPEEPKNLKVLPKDMPRREVIGVMRSFNDALGVRCIECHVSRKPGSERPDDMDFAADDKPEKDVARKMLKLVASINDQIGQMGMKDAAPVRCVTCHRGVKHPETLGAVLMKATAKGGSAAAVESYRKLRDRYYGSGAYDFSPESLVGVAGDLAESKKDFDGALALLQLNLEFSPKHADTHVAIGRVQLAKGDKAAAVASFEKALELDPNNRGAKMMLERARGGQ